MTHDVRARFPGLSDGWVRLDGPAGTLPVDTCVDAIADYMRSPAPANLGGEFDASRESDAVVERRPRGASRALVGAEPDEVVFGPSTTNLMFAFTRALARHWEPGDRIVCTQLDHDSNVSPWLLAARDVGATVEMLEVDPVDGTLDVEPLKRALRRRPHHAGSRSPAPRTSPATRPTSPGPPRSRTSTARGSSSTASPACRTCRPTPPRSASTCSRPRRTSGTARTPACSSCATNLLREIEPYRVRPADYDGPCALGDRDGPDRGARRHHRRRRVHARDPRRRRGRARDPAARRCCRRGCTRCPASPCTARR